VVTRFNLFPYEAGHPLVILLRGQSSRKAVLFPVRTDSKLISTGTERSSSGDVDFLYHAPNNFVADSKLLPNLSVRDTILAP
jgi:hypothetical protein